MYNKRVVASNSVVEVMRFAFRWLGSIPASLPNIN